jgi:hypothetical protein
MEFGLSGGVLLNTRGAFQHCFLILIFPRGYGTGTPFLPEPAAARQDFSSFFHRGCSIRLRFEAAARVARC